jgi:hypothetical protein
MGRLTGRPSCTIERRETQSDSVTSWYETSILSTLSSVCSGHRHRFAGTAIGDLAWRAPWKYTKSNTFLPCAKI